MSAKNYPVKPGDQVGDKVEGVWPGVRPEEKPRPWKSAGILVWHKETGKGPWVVLRDEGDLVYVDVRPGAAPATKRDCSFGNGGRKLTLNHSDVECHYGVLLTSVEPESKALTNWTLGDAWPVIVAVFYALVALVVLALKVP